MEKKKKKIWAKIGGDNRTFEDVDVNFLSFWVQLQSLPLHYYKESTVRRIIERAGVIKEICFQDENGLPYEDTIR